MHITLSQNSNTCDFFIFGATGMQGKIVIKDLVRHGFTICASARNANDLKKLSLEYPSIKTCIADLATDSLFELVYQYKPKVIINCAEGDWNVKVYELALLCNSHVIDLGSDVPTTKIQLGMHSAFEEKNLTAITGCGSTPGINNIMLNYIVNTYETVDTIEAGFAWNSNIKIFVVPFSMESIIEEFTQLAPYIENNQWLEIEPLETVEEKEFHTVGLQKVFLVRHPEQYTFYKYYQFKGVKNVKYYAGFPNHSYEKILNYINTSDYEKTKIIKVPGKGDVTLRDLTKVLQEVHPIPIGYTENENLWVKIKGVRNGNTEETLMECIVPTLKDWQEAGCNIDTGLPASIISQMLFNEIISKRGSFAPEAVIPPQPFFIALETYGMTIYENGKKCDFSKIKFTSEPEHKTNVQNSSKMFLTLGSFFLFLFFICGMLIQKIFNF